MYDNIINETMLYSSVWFLHKNIRGIINCDIIIILLIKDKYNVCIVKFCAV